MKKEIERGMELVILFGVLFLVGDRIIDILNERNKDKHFDDVAYKDFIEKKD